MNFAIKMFYFSHLLDLVFDLFICSFVHLLIHLVIYLKLTIRYCPYVHFFI